MDLTWKTTVILSFFFFLSFFGIVSLVDPFHLSNCFHIFPLWAQTWIKSHGKRRSCIKFSLLLKASTHMIEAHQTSACALAYLANKLSTFQSCKPHCCCRHRRHSSCDTRFQWGKALRNVLMQQHNTIDFCKV